MKKYYIEIPDLNIKKIHSIDLILENMECVTVYHNELVEINLEFEDELILSGWCIERRVKRGYIKLRIDEKTKREKGDINIDDDKGRTIKKPSKEKIEGRLLELCNICTLGVELKDKHWSEQIDVPYNEEFNKDKNGYTEDKIIICPSAKIDEKGNLVILFGESSEYNPDDFEGETIEDFRRRWRRYTKVELQAICAINGIACTISDTREELINKLTSYFYNRYLEFKD